MNEHTKPAPHRGHDAHDHHHHDHGHDHHHHDHHHDHDHDDHDHHGGHHHHHSFGWGDAFRIVVAGLCALAAWLGLPDHSYMVIGDEIFLPFSWYGLIGLGIGGWPLFKEAWESILRRQMTMELSMGIAVLAAAWTSYFSAALIITFFVLVAEALEGMTLERGRRAIRDLMDLLPHEVSIRRSGVVTEISARELREGDAVIVAPGGRIPVDGPVLNGHSFVDESRITGEAMPVEKLAGARAYAGTINQSGSLEIRAERIGRDTSYGQILEAVERAEKSRAPIQSLADKLAGYIVIVALGFAALEYWLSRDVTEAISVIVVAGACGVAAGTPLAILGAIGRSAKLGAIVKGGIHLETLGKVRTVVLDKTGTLTFGQPEVSAIKPRPGIAAGDLLAAAATAEIRSEHPLGKAVMAHIRGEGVEIVEPTHFAYTPGRGILAHADGAEIVVGNTLWLSQNGIDIAGIDGAAGSEILVARNGVLLGSIAIEDKVRPEAQKAVAALKQMNIHTVLLTGDAPEVAEGVAQQLGIDRMEARLLPEEKLARIEKLVANGQAVAMVGDGINDAPALAAASVGVAMGSGTEVAREKADIVLLGNDLERFVETVRVARRAKGIIWFNFAGTVIIDLLGVACAMMGWIGPVEAAAIHTISELAFILNSARLLPSPIFWKPPEALAPPESRLAAHGRVETVGA